MASERNPTGIRPRAQGAFTAVVVCGLVLAVAGMLRLDGQGGGPSGTALTAGGPSAQIEDSGLTLSLRITPGPYFLGELMAAEVQLTNGSHASYELQGIPRVTGCNQALGVALTGGEAPTYTLPTVGFSSCPLVSSILAPGQVWTVDQFLPLTASGTVALAAQAIFFTTTVTGGVSIATAGPGPFAAPGWPTLHLSVAPAPPAGHAITLHPTTNRRGIWTVSIDAPWEARARLYSIFDVTCREGQGEAEEPGITWKWIDGTSLSEPSCPARTRCGATRSARLDIASRRESLPRAAEQAYRKSFASPLDHGVFQHPLGLVCLGRRGSSPATWKLLPSRSGSWIASTW